jgi:hypothetical protein
MFCIGVYWDDVIGFLDQWLQQLSCIWLMHWRARNGEGSMIVWLLFISTIYATLLPVTILVAGERTTAPVPLCPTAAQQAISASCAWSTRQVPATGVANLAGAIWRPSLPELLVSHTPATQQPSSVPGKYGHTFVMHLVHSCCSQPASL